MTSKPPSTAAVTAQGDAALLGLEASAGEGFRVEGERAYRLIRLLGEGGMGRVFLAERADGEFHHEVAIKLIAWHLGDDEATARRFRIERQILAQLNHPNIARLLDGGTTAKGQSYLVMEYVEGVPIDRFVAERQLPVAERLRLFLKVCDAVKVAHQSLVVHRDLKPGNILVTSEGEPKLLDFGIAKLLAPEPGRELMETRHGEISATPRYASPEQMRSEPITTASDVYALGVVLYELVAERSPYKPESLSLLRLPTAVCTEVPLPPSAGSDGSRRRDIGPDLDAIVLKALRKEPHERYASVDALAEDLRSFLDGRPVAAREGTTTYQLGKFLERHRWSVSAAAGVGLLLLGWAFSLCYQLAQTEKERLLAERARELLVEVVGGSDPAAARSRELTAKEVLDRATERVLARDDDPPELRASTLASLGRVYLSLGLLDQAEPLLVEALDTGLAPGSGAPAERAQGTAALARLRYLQGRTDESVDLLSAALERDGERLDDGLRAGMKSLLGRSLVERGHYPEGEAALREALALGRHAARTSRSELVESLVSLGLVVAVRRPVARRQEAEGFLREAIDQARDRPGAERVDPMLLEGALENLAWIHLDAGDWQRAEPLVSEAEDLARERVGDDHPSLLDLRNYRAMAQWRKGDFAGAEETLRRTLEQHPDLADYPTYERLRGNLGAMEILQGRFAEGEDKALHALAAHRRTGTVGWADVFYDLWILTFSAFDRGDLRAARDYAEQGVEEAARLPPNLPYLAMVRSYRGAATSWLDGPEAGEADLRAVVEAQRVNLPAEHPDRVLPLAELAAALLRLGRLDEAEDAAREAAAVALPATYGERAWALAVQAAVDLARGRAGARAALARHLARVEGRHGSEHPRAVWLRSRLRGNS